MHQGRGIKLECAPNTHAPRQECLKRTCTQVGAFGPVPNIETMRSGVFELMCPIAIGP